MADPISSKSTCTTKNEIILRQGALKNEQHFKVHSANHHKLTTLTNDVQVLSCAEYLVCNLVNFRTSGERQT